MKANSIFQKAVVNDGSGNGKCNELFLQARQLLPIM